jgi:hypothetical protein
VNRRFMGLRLARLRPTVLMCAAAGIALAVIAPSAAAVEGQNSDGVSGSSNLGELVADGVESLTENGLPGRDNVFTVVGQNNPAVDPANVQQAVNQAFASIGGTVQLIGTFDFGACSLCVIVPGPVTISGTSDPSTSDGSGISATVIKASGLAPIAVIDSGSSLGNITIERIWFNGAQTLAVLLLQVRGTFTFSNNKVSGVLPGKEFRFAVAGASVGTVPEADSTSINAALTRFGTADGPRLTGSVVLNSNVIDNNVPMAVGDDNGFAFAQCHLKDIRVTNNVIRAGEAVEIEGCRGPGAVYVIANNTITQTSTPSNLAQLTNSPGLVRHGGHPAAIKPIDSEAALVIIRGNRIDMSDGPRTGVCIMTGNANDLGSTRIVDNTCVMKGQFAAVLGGWAGTPGFFNPSYMQNTTVHSNRFLGRAMFGFALRNFTFLQDPTMTLANLGHDNVVYNNDARAFIATRAAVDLGLMTRNNVVINDFRGDVVDRGVKNTVDTQPNSRTGRFTR